MSETHWQGCDTVHPDCHHPALLALAGLIGELRDIYEDMGGGWDLKEATDRAETRLKEVTDE